MGEGSAIYVGSESFADFVIDHDGPGDVDNVSELPVGWFTTGVDDDPFQARVIGFGSSYIDGHKDHVQGTLPPLDPETGKLRSCSGCRWVDVAIFRSVDSYGVLTVGKSILPGEVDKVRVRWSGDPLVTLKNLLTVQRPGAWRPGIMREDGRRMHMALPNAQAFREAAVIDDRLAVVLEEHGAVIPEPSEYGR